jgi:hypothetical protein
MIAQTWIKIEKHPKHKKKGYLYLYRFKPERGDAYTLGEFFEFFSDRGHRTCTHFIAIPLIVFDEEPS